MESVKYAYVNSTRALKRLVRPLGLLEFLESKRSSRLCLFIRSLFSVYDAQDLARLDLPWWSFDAIDFINSVLARRGSQMTVFEYGSGASTLWLSKRCKSVHSVEHDADWARQVQNICADRPNVTITTVPAPLATISTRCHSARTGWTKHSFDDYVESIRYQPAKFDMIVVDGRARVDCLAEAKGMLNDGGIIVFDNSNRQQYRRALDTVGLPRRVFRGLVPGLPFPGETTVFGAAGFQDPSPGPGPEAQ